MRNYNNQTLAEDGRLLSDMREKGMNDEAARILLETYNIEPYTVSDWDEILYHADMFDQWKEHLWDDHDTEKLIDDLVA